MIMIRCLNRSYGEQGVRTFIYKRTHRGDPSPQGHFGNEDCMGKLRNCSFDAVIGIGGIGWLARSQGINSKLNWIGIGPKRFYVSDRRGPIVGFDHFVLFEENGEEFHGLAPTLAGRMLTAKGPRFLFSDRFNDAELKEVSRILKLAKTAPPSRRYNPAKGVKGCESRGCDRKSAHGKIRC